MFIDPQETAIVKSIKCNRGWTFQLAGALGALEVIEIEQPDGAGGWMPVIIDGEALVLSIDNTILSLYQPALIRINKPVTVGEVGVQLIS